MFAVQYRSYGGPEVLSLGEAPEPHAGPGQVRVKVEAAGINGIDFKERLGYLSGGQPLSGVGYPGRDAAGVVDEVGPDVTGVQVGDPVFGIGTGTHAEYAVLSAWVAKDPAINWAVAGGAGIAVETAERGLRLLGVKQGDTVFIDGGSGGVGSAAVQLAVAADARVIASASQDNHDYLREIGAYPVLYGSGLVDRVRAAPLGEVSAVFDVAGKTPVEDLLALAPESSQVLSIANFTVIEAGARVTSGGPDAQPLAALALAAQLLTDGRLTLEVLTFPFDRFAEGYAIVESGHGRGKVVLVP